jgi:hypothetical protein
VLKAVKPGAIEKHFLPLARKPADESKNTASVVDPRHFGVDLDPWIHASD